MGKRRGQGKRPAPRPFMTVRAFCDALKSAGARGLGTMSHTFPSIHRHRLSAAVRERCPVRANAQHSSKRTRGTRASEPAKHTRARRALRAARHNARPSCQLPSTAAPPTRRRPRERRPGKLGQRGHAPAPGCAPRLYGRREPRSCRRGSGAAQLCGSSSSAGARACLLRC